MNSCVYLIDAFDVPLPDYLQPEGWGKDKEHCLCKEVEVGECSSLEAALAVASIWARDNNHPPHLVYIAEWSLDESGDVDEPLRGKYLEEWMLTEPRPCGIVGE